MNTEYYIVEDGERRGPFSIDTLKSRGLGRETLVWRQGLTEWTRADQLPELTDLFAAEESAFGTYAEAQPQPQTEPYFAMLGNTRIGPLMPQELAAHGITAETPVWRNGMAEWMPASTQPELMQAISMRQAAQALEKAEECTACKFHAPVILVVAYDPAKAWNREGDMKNHGEIDATIAATQMMLQAADLGLGTCYVGMFSQEKLHELFPEMKGLVATAMLPLGYPAETAHPSRLHTDRMPLDEMVIRL